MSILGRTIEGLKSDYANLVREAEKLKESREGVAKRVSRSESLLSSLQVSAPSVSVYLY